MQRLLIKFCILLLCVACSNQIEYTADFSDGLPTPDKTEQFNVYDNYGTKKIDTFFIDINNNGKKDIIKRGRFVTGTAHSYTFYDIYLDDGELLTHLTTQEGADCVVRAYKFQIQPFVIIKASRSIGKDYIEPTKAKVETFEIKNNKLESISGKNYSPICDVRYLL